ncbi:MAG: hypothetical protein JSR53_04800 [Proteobacteria bacterium]|nr:hypothetical protein [Pseudomonadota bacterium]
MVMRFFNPASVYARRAQRCLDDARMAALEHENAAEHHMALAKMYRHRAARLEAELAPPNPHDQVMQDASVQPPRITALKKPKDHRQAAPTFLAQGSTG